jgi:hypothetical protein
MYIKHFFTIMILSMMILLAGCDRSDVKYTDLTPGTMASVSGENMIIHLGSYRKASDRWTSIKTKIDGQKIYVYGYLTAQKQGSEFILKLPASVNPESVSVVWINPDGTHVTIRINR